MNKFGGFSEKGMERVARKLGYSGPMHKFNEFLSASPNGAAKLSQYAEKARAMVEGGGNFAKGGVVKKVDDKTSSSTKNVIKYTANTPASSEGSKITTTAINDPEKVATLATAVPTKTEGGQLIDKNSGQVGAAHTVTPATTTTTATAADPTKPAVANATTATSSGAVNDATEGLVGATGTMSGGSQATAAQAQPSADATVQGQLSKLMQQFEGGETPAWAAGAMRLANTVMAQRGLGSSSMAGAAVTQAAMESALQIAVNDAATYSAFEMKNLDNRQQAALQNAQGFLQMDLQNLNNAQEALMFKTQSRVQALFTDTAAENATRQFNATSQNQVNQFFAELKTQVDTFNATQKNTMSMFKTEQGNAVSMFNAEQQNARDQFNANNRLIIDQSNAKWRQTIATQDNAQINETNRLNAQLATGLTTAAYNNLWQKERDIMEYVFTASENANQRAHEVVLQKMSGKTSKSIADQGGPNILGEAAGKLVGSLADGLAGKIFG